MGITVRPICNIHYFQPLFFQTSVIIYPYMYAPSDLCRVHETKLFSQDVMMIFQEMIKCHL